MTKSTIGRAITAAHRAAVTETRRQRMKRHAAIFLADPDLPGDRATRVAEAHQDIDLTGTYELTEAERSHGVRVAWRDFAGCIGRGSWRSLALIDLSDTWPNAEATLQACQHHLSYGTNGGQIKPLITLLPPDRKGRPGPRIWNDQLVRYAGIARPDGSTVGDPAHLDLTLAIRTLGWDDEVGRFTPLPIVVQIPGQEPVWGRVPTDLIQEVRIRHPNYTWFSELGLRWHATPAISKMRLYLGGVDFPCIFNGWYVLSEVYENLGHPRRYNQLPVIAQRLGIDLRDPLFQDDAEPVLLRAILHSYRADKVTIEDHHRADERHHKFVARMRRAGHVVRGDRDKLLLPTSTVTMSARTEHYSPPDPDAAATFYYPPDPWSPPSTSIANADSHSC